MWNGKDIQKDQSNTGCWVLVLFFYNVTFYVFWLAVKGSREDRLSWENRSCIFVFIPFLFYSISFHFHFYLFFGWFDWQWKDQERIDCHQILGPTLRRQHHNNHYPHTLHYKLKENQNISLFSYNKFVPFWYWKLAGAVEKTPCK